MTLVEVAAVTAAVGVVAAAVALFTARTDAAEDAERVRDDAARILDAADAWLVDHEATGCPTIGQLVHDRALDDAAPTDDPWGSRFRLVCDGEGLLITSPGPDGRSGTADDLEIDLPARG